MNPVYFIGHSLLRGVFECFFQLRVIGYEKLIQEGPCIYVANHQSYLDPPLLGQLFEGPVHYLARKTLFDPPIMKCILPSCNALPIDQVKPNPGSILGVLRLVRAGGRIIIFPEGARSPDGQIHEAMPGIGLIIGKLAGVPVQPLRIKGAFECLPIHSRRLRFCPLTVSVGEPMTFTTEELHGKGRQGQLHIGHKIMDAIRSLPTDFV